MIISFEGIDDSGKSTLINVLGTYLKQQHLKCGAISELNIAHPINDLIKKNDGGNEFDQVTQFLLIEALRRDLFINKVKPLLDQNYTVIYDRFIHSTLVYQGYFDNIDLGLINALNDFTTNFTVPDLTFWIDISYDVYKSRKVGDDYSEDNFNKYKQAYEDTFVNYILELPEGKEVHRVTVTDVNNSPEEIWEQHIKPIIDQKFGFIKTF